MSDWTKVALHEQVNIHFSIGKEIETIGNESFQEIRNDNGVRVNFATSRNLTAKITMFPHRKYTWTSPDG
jgi:hypothetical protein